MEGLAPGDEPGRRRLALLVLSSKARPQSNSPWPPQAMKGLPNIVETAKGKHEGHNYFLWNMQQFWYTSRNTGIRADRMELGATRAGLGVPSNMLSCSP